MVDYTFTAGDNNKLIMHGNFAQGSILVNIPEEDPSRLEYISFFIHKSSIEFGIDCLHCISLDNHQIINKALFLSALTSLIKCFQKSNKYILLYENQFRKVIPPHTFLEYERFKDLRNKHYIHEENNMTEATAFLFVSPEGSDTVMGGLPSVVFTKAELDIISESKKLEEVMQEAWKFVANSIDKIGDHFLQKYGKESRETLLSYGSPQFKLAQPDNINK